MANRTWISGLGLPGELDEDGELEIQLDRAGYEWTYLDKSQAISLIKLLADRFDINLDIFAETPK